MATKEGKNHNPAQISTKKRITDLFEILRKGIKNKINAFLCIYNNN